MLATAVHEQNSGMVRFSGTRTDVHRHRESALVSVDGIGLADHPEICLVRRKSAATEERGCVEKDAGAKS